MATTTNRLALTSVTVRDALGATLHTKVSVRSEGDTVEIRSGSNVLRTLTGVTEVKRFTAASFQVTSDAGVFLIDIPRGGGCGCGR